MRIARFLVVVAVMLALVSETVLYFHASDILRASPPTKKTFQLSPRNIFGADSPRRIISAIEVDPDALAAEERRLFQQFLLEMGVTFFVGVGLLYALAQLSPAPTTRR